MFGRADQSENQPSKTTLEHKIQDRQLYAISFLHIEFR